MGPYGALNPHSIWILVILVMAIGAAGHLAVRILGPVSASLSRVSHQVSFQAPRLSAAMGARAAKTTDLLMAAVAGCGIVNGCDHRTDGACSRRH